MPTPYTIEDDHENAIIFAYSGIYKGWSSIGAYAISGTQDYQFDTLVVYHYANTEQHK